MLLSWQLLSTFVVNPHLLPPPTKVVGTAGPLLLTGELIGHITASLTRIAVGFLAGSAAAIVLGVVMGRIRWVSDFMQPITQPLRFLSPTAMIPIAIVWFGIGELSKYFLVFYGTFFTVLINTIAGVAETPVTRIRAAQTLGASEVQIFLKVVLPSAIPYLIAGMRIALASAFMAIIPAEMLAADEGLGFMLQQAGLLVQTNRIFVALAVISLLGFLADGLFRLVTNRILHRFLQEGGGA